QPRVAHETPSFEMVRGLVANGHGYSVMHSRPASDQALDGMRLVYRPVSEKIRPTWLGLVRRKDARPRRMAPPFPEFCRAFLGAADPTAARASSRTTRRRV